MKGSEKVKAYMMNDECLTPIHNEMERKLFFSIG